MKILKRLIPLVLLFSLLLPLSSVFASTGGLLFGKTIIGGNALNNTFQTYPTAITDGDSSTAVGTNSGQKMFWYKFDRAATITDYKLHYFDSAGPAGGVTLNNSTIKLYNSAGTVIRTITNANGTNVKTALTSTSNVYYVSVENTESYTRYVAEFDVFGTLALVVTTNVTNFVASNITTTGTNLNWTNPTDSNFNGSKIYQNNALIAMLDKTISSYSVSSLSPGTEYTFKITSINPDGTETTGTTTTVKTIELIKEITELKVETEYNRVNLSWNVPEQTIFKHVNIYRTEVQRSGLFSSLAATTAYAAEEETKIFETNGTYFNDLTVQPETSYEYTLTTQSTDGQESEGVTVEATTEAEPIPVMSGLDYTINENGDYVYTWTEPTKGTVKAIINGTEYISVPASEGTLTIPKEDIKLTGFGDPETSFQPYGEYGAEGKVYRMQGKSIQSPFGVNDLMLSTMSLLKLVGPFILLGLSFLLVPRFRKLIRQAFGRFRKSKNQGVERRSQGDPSDRHEGKEYLEKKERIERERQERESRERIERERSNKEIKVITEKAPKEQTRQPRERVENPSRRLRGVRQARVERTPRERNRQSIEQRERRTRRE